MATANGGRTGIFYDVRTKKNRSACMAQTRAHITHETVNKCRKQKRGRVYYHNFSLYTVFLVASVCWGKCVSESCC